MSITININDGQAGVIPPQATATLTNTAADRSAGPCVLLAGATASTSVHVHAETRDAGVPAAALIQEVESALGQLVETAPVAANQGQIDTDAAPI